MWSGGKGGREGRKGERGVGREGARGGVTKQCRGGDPTLLRLHLVFLHGTHG